MHKHFWLIFVAGCSAADVQMQDSGEELTPDAAEGFAGSGGGGAEDGGERADVSLSGFEDGGAPDANLDAAVHPDATAEEQDASISRDLFEGSWDTEEMSCGIQGNVYKRTITFEVLDPPHTTLFGVSPYALYPDARRLYFNGDELITEPGNGDGDLRFWLVDENTLGGSISISGQDPPCPQYFFHGTRVET